MDRSMNKLVSWGSLVTDETIDDSAGNGLSDSAPCCSGTNQQYAMRFKQEGPLNSSVNLWRHNEIQNENMENALIEPSFRMMSSMVLIAPLDDDFSKGELYQTNRRSVSTDHQDDLNQDPTIPAVKQEMMDIVIKTEKTEDVLMEEIDDEKVPVEAQNCEEYIKLEGDINWSWVDKLKVTGKTEAQTVMKNKMSEDRPKEDLKSERIIGDLLDDQTSALTFYERVHKRRYQPRTATVTSFADGGDYNESCTLSSVDERDSMEKKINDSKSVHHLHSDQSDAKFYEGSQCHKHVKSSKSLPNHMQTQTQSNKSFRCPDCDKEFKQLRHLNSHAVRHADIKLMVCPVCGLSFHSKTALSKHQSVHGKFESFTHTGEQSFACEICNKSFTKAALFHNHMISHRNMKLFIQCPDCNKPFKNLSSLKRHQRTHTGEKPYACSMCDKHFRTRDNLKVHQRTHTGKKPYACSRCDKSFRDQTPLKVQIGEALSLTGERLFTCELCSLSFTKPTLFHNHMITHQNMKLPSCPDCDKSFRCLSELKAHQRTHTGEKPYACTMCDQSFSDKSYLKRHQRTHTGEKPYSCTMCDQSFSDQSYLKRHQRTHTGEKPYRCTMCDQSFRTPQALQRHQKIHSK